MKLFLYFNGQFVLHRRHAVHILSTSLSMLFTVGTIPNKSIHSVGKEICKRQQVVHTMTSVV
jgi:hypothetical protein